MMHWKDLYGNWEGTAAELADVAERLVTELGLADDGTTPNERLVRHYVQVGVLSRPERRGKEAVFGFRQLVEFLAARAMLRDGWPLAKIAELTNRVKTGDLMDMLPRPAGPNRAQELVARYRQVDAIPSPAACMSMEDVRPMFSRSLSMTRDKLAMQESLQALGNTEADPGRREFLRLELAPWCHVYVDVAELKGMPPETPELLGHTLARVLQDEKSRKGAAE